MLLKVISGGQTGADFAGLVAAKAIGLQTGGCMPKGYKTLQGPRPDYRELFDIREHESSSYRSRTFENVRDSDATLRLAHDFTSAGERCTLKAIMQYQRHYLDVQFILGDEGMHMGTDRTAEDVAGWINSGEYQVLNVAGNAGIWFETRVEAFLEEVFREVKRAERPLHAVR